MKTVKSVFAKDDETAIKIQTYKYTVVMNCTNVNN